MLLHRHDRPFDENSILGSLVALALLFIMSHCIFLMIISFLPILIQPHQEMVTLFSWCNIVFLSFFCWGIHKKWIGLHWASDVFLLITASSTTCALFFYGGLYNPIVWAYPLLPIVALYSTNYLKSVFWLLLSCIFIISIYIYTEKNSAEIVKTYVINQSLLSQQIFTLFFFVLLIVISYGIGAVTEIRYQHLLQQQKKTQKLLAQAKAKSEQAAVMRDLFWTNISHEIRTPMNGVLGMVEYLRTNESHNLGILKQLDTIQHETENLLSLVEQAIAYAHLSPRPTRSPINDDAHFATHDSVLTQTDTANAIVEELD